MRRALRQNALSVFAAGIGSATVAWLGLYGFAWNDYEAEAQPAFNALAHGHLTEFLRLAPAYGGSLIERAPFALLPRLWGGGELAVYRMVALPALLAAAALGVWLVARMRSEGRSTLARAVTLGVLVANPITLSALEIGHPEELLGAALSVAAVLLASRGRPVWAGVLLGLAIANKQWALLALGPVLLALPARRWLRCLTGTGVLAASVLAPLVLVGSSAFVAGTRAAATASSAFFQPWQVWWFLGTPNHVPALGSGAHTIPLSAPLSTHPQWRLAPPWLPGIVHPLILAVGLGLAGALWLRRGRRTPHGSGQADDGSPGTSDGSVSASEGSVGERDVLLLLALIMLMRSLLDTWNVIYYMLPFVFALLVWEVRGPANRPPVLALSVSVLAWISFVWLPSHASPDVQSALFLAWSLPLAAALGLMLYRSGRPELERRLRPAWHSHGQEMVVSSFGSPVRHS